MHNRIKQIRIELEMSQEQFGARLGVTKTAISAIENGRRNVTSQMIISICREFNVNKDWLNTGAGDMFNKIDKDAELYRYCGEICAGKYPLLTDVIYKYCQLSADEMKVVNNAYELFISKKRSNQES